MIERTSLIVLCFIASFISHAASVWEVTDGKNQLFIGGTIHILSPGDYPLPTEFDRVYHLSDTLVFETDLQAINAVQFQQMMMQEMAFHDGRTFKDVLAPETVKALEHHFASRNIPIDSLLSFKPSLLALTISNVEFQLAGLTSEGVDMFFANRAVKDSKVIRWLESPREQILFLAALGKGQEDELIQYTLDEVTTLNESIDELKRHWRSGDMEKLRETQLDEMQTLFPDVYAQLLVERNNRWIEPILDMLDSPEKEFVLVGALHLAGDDSVLTLLENKGLTIRKFN